MLKSKKVLNVLAILVLFAFIFNLCSCSKENYNDNKKPPQISSLATPKIYALGDFLYWDVVYGATQYEIYLNNKLATSTADNTYYFGEITESTECYIVAKNELSTAKSNLVYLSKNASFTADEILDLTNKNSFYGLISSTIKKIIIKGDGENYFWLNAKIENRTTDLFFEITDAIIEGEIYTQDNDYTRSKHDFSVIFTVNGNCKIYASDGADGEDYSESYYDDMEIDGEAGANGDCAIIAPTVVFCGNGNGGVYGGDGGDGGNGSSTTTYEPNNGPGAGSNGGNGEGAIKTSMIVVNMGEESVVEISDGKGGKKGTPGNNGSIFTGPLVSVLWNELYDIGKNGKDGESILGIEIVLKGKLL